MGSEEEKAENCLSGGRPEPSGTIRNHLEGPRGEIRSRGVARNHLQVAPTPWGAQDEMPAPVARAGGGLKNQDFIQRNEV